MTLRRTLLLAFVLLGLLPSAALSWLSFTRTRDAMVGQIRLNLQVQARGIQADIDQMLFERFENAVVWSRSELMQDLRLGDVDKRVTNDLVDLQAGYPGMYGYLDARSGDGRVIASSVPARIGRSVPVADPSSVSVRRVLGGSVVTLSLPTAATLDDVAPLLIETAIDAPVSQMAFIFAALLVAVFIATLLAAAWIARAISRPIAALTARTRRYQQGLAGADDAPLVSRVAEIEMLARAYDDMVRAVERSRLELVRTSKMAMLGELAAVLAHEVRTPLGILRSSAQILRRDSTLSPEGRELMSFIESETDRLNRLVSTMLDTARPRPPALVECDLHHLLRRCVQMHDLRRGPEGVVHPVVLDLAATRIMARVDAEQWMQVVFNLLSNASQAAGPRGRVELSTFDGPHGLHIACADNGPGIAPAFADRIFDPFVSGREGGIGLGLAVVRQVVAAHQGEIVVGRSASGGASFVVSLPASAIVSPLESPS